MSFKVTWRVVNVVVARGRTGFKHRELTGCLVKNLLTIAQDSHEWQAFLAAASIHVLPTMTGTSQGRNERLIIITLINSQITFFVTFLLNNLHLYNTKHLCQSLTVTFVNMLFLLPASSVITVMLRPSLQNPASFGLQVTDTQYVVYGFKPQNWWEVSLISVTSCKNYTKKWNWIHNLLFFISSIYLNSPYSPLLALHTYSHCTVWVMLNLSWGHTILISITSKIYVYTNCVFHLTIYFMSHYWSPWNRHKIEWKQGECKLLQDFGQLKRKNFLLFIL